MRVMVFKEILEKDYESMRGLVLPYTGKEIRKMKQKYVEKFFRHYIKKRFVKFEKNESPPIVFFVKKLWSRVNRRKVILSDI